MKMLSRALLSIVLAHAVAAQLRESVTVEVIDVPVYVNDGSGPIRNLTKEDFELFVNGKRQEIEYFDEIDFTAAPAKGAEAATDVRERRLFLLLFDLVFTRPAALDRARKAAAELIDRAGSADSFAVATFTHNKGVQFVVPFTNDRAAARHAALHLATGAARDPLALATPRMQQPVYAGFPLPVVEMYLEDVRLDPTVSNISRRSAARENAGMPMKRMIEAQAAGFDELARRMAQLDGARHVIVLSEGFNPFIAFGLIQELRRMSEAFRAANVMIDAIDLGGNVREMVLSDALHYMARETGGQFVQLENDFADAFNRISNASAIGYRLGFRRPANAKDGMNTIDVKVRNLPAGARLAFRRGFSGSSKDLARFDSLYLADIILNDIPQTGVAPRIVFRERPFLDVDVPSIAFTSGTVEVLLYVFDASGAVVEFKQGRLASQGSLRARIELPSGSYVAKALLRSGDSIGFTRVPFAIP